MFLLIFYKLYKPIVHIAPEGKFNYDGSNGVPLKGDPSESQAFLSISSWFYSSVVGNPFIFLSYS